MEVSERQRVEKAQQIAEIRAQDAKRELVSNNNVYQQAQTTLQERTNKFHTIIKLLGESKPAKQHGSAWQQLQSRHSIGLLGELKLGIARAKKELKIVKEQGQALLKKYQTEQLKIDLLKVREQRLLQFENLRNDNRVMAEQTDNNFIKRSVTDSTFIEGDLNLENMSLQELQSTTDTSAGLTTTNISSFSGFQEGAATLNVDANTEQTRQDNLPDMNEEVEQKQAPKNNKWQEYIKQTFKAEEFKVDFENGASKITFNWSYSSKNLAFEIQEAGTAGVNIKLINVQHSQAEVVAVKNKVEEALRQVGIKVIKFETIK